MWNALMSGATPLGAPSSTPLDVYITGNGFPTSSRGSRQEGSMPTSYSHATCRFSLAAVSRRQLLPAPHERALVTRPADQLNQLNQINQLNQPSQLAQLALAPHTRQLQSITSYARPAQILSETLALCSMPNISRVGEWALELLLNGQTAEPVLYNGAADAPLFTIYNLSEVHVTSVVPPGAPVCNIAASAQAGCEPTGVIMYGAGFADYGGAGSLVCVVDGAPQPATLLDSRRVLCEMPPMASPRTVELTVSLNNATSGTIPTSSLSFAYYQVPTLLTLTPASGNAMGGTLVTISGHGGHFEGLAADEATRLQYLRVKFGEVIQPQPVLRLTPHELVVHAPWGQSGAALVTLALNGISFAFTGKTLHFNYYGLHAAQLVDAYFPAAATTLVIQFDAQPTNRAGMNGQQPCATVLSDATVRVLRGSAEAAPLCAWTDDSTLVAFLTKFTDARPGMAVEVLPDKIWPAEWEYAGSCDVAESLCARSNLTMTIDADYPCDLRATTLTRELCATPFVTVQAPNDVGSCLETPLQLDGSDYLGAGYKPLLFQWAAHPLFCDDYYALQAQIAPQASSDRVALRVSAGSSFFFTLTITNFLGSSYRTTVTVSRRATPTPTVTITSPAVLEVRGTVRTTIEAIAESPPCEAGFAVPISFRWQNIRSETLDGAYVTPITLSEQHNRARDLMIDPSILTPGIKYTMQITAVLGEYPFTAAVDESVVMLADEALVASIEGGSRSVAVGASVQLSACNSGDIDEPDALFNFSWSYYDTSRRNVTTHLGSFRGVGLGAAAVDGACTYEVQGSLLEPGRSYEFVVLVSHGDESATASVTVHVAVVSDENPTGALPVVAIEELKTLRHNANARLKLFGSISVPEPYNITLPENASYLVQQATIKSDANLSWSSPQLDLGNVTQGGVGSLSLHVLRGVLTPGAQYDFELRASLHGGVEAFASVRVTVNRPPFGGDLTLTHETPLVALSDNPVRLLAGEWTDDDYTDLPLRYSFRRVRLMPDTHGGQREDGDEMPLGRLSTSKRGTWRLPVGGVWRLKVRVFDVWGAVATDFGQVEVPPPHRAPPPHTCSA
jgi:hypothetical protein